jgi:hypothetical protein
MREYEIENERGGEIEREREREREREKKGIKRNTTLVCGENFFN